MRVRFEGWTQNTETSRTNHLPDARRACGAPFALHGSVTSEPRALAFDPISLLTTSSLPMLILSLMLVATSVLVWFLIALKLQQLRAWSRAERAFQDVARKVTTSAGLKDHLEAHRQSIGAGLLDALIDEDLGHELVDSEIDHILTREQDRVFSGMTVLSTTAAAAPLAGLFGTVYGLMEAFARIGLEKSAALPVVAPAIGDALITTALGLFAAIPAVVAFNLLSRRGERLLEDARTFARAWLKRAVRGAA